MGSTQTQTNWKSSDQERFPGFATTDRNRDIKNSKDLFDFCFGICGGFTVHRSRLDRRNETPSYPVVSQAPLQCIQRLDTSRVPVSNGASYKLQAEADVVAVVVNKAAVSARRKSISVSKNENTTTTT